MKKSQKIHLDHMLDQAVLLLTKKYKKGAREHSGDLLDLTPLQLVEESIGETIDQLTYLLTLRDKLLEGC